jgi:uncharacterized protein
MQQVLMNFWVMFREAAPWFLAGALIGVAAQRWLKPAWIERWVSNSRGSVFTAALAGALLPGCAMSTMPLASAFKERGVKVGTLTAFIMIAPILSPQTVALNAVMLGAPMTIGRVVIPLVLTVALGLLLNALLSKRIAPAQLVAAENSGGSCCNDTGCCGGDAAGADGFGSALIRVLKELLPYFLIGLLAVAVLQIVIPQEMLVRHMQQGWSAYLIAAAAGVPLYVCEGGEVPLTAALLKLGIGPGPAFTFLLASVGTCLPTIAMAPKVIGWFATVCYLVAWLLLALGGGWVMSWFAGV